MLLKSRFVVNGPGPAEVVVAIATRDGEEEIVVNSRLINDHTLEIGSPIGRDGGSFLVELPRETTSGKWRVWVPEAEIRQTA